MLGDCCDGEQSHLVGFGPKWPIAIHHRGSSCKGADPESCSCTALANAHTLWGALIAGPTRDDQLSVDGTNAGGTRGGWVVLPNLILF